MASKKLDLMKTLVNFPDNHPIWFLIASVFLLVVYLLVTVSLGVYLIWATDFSVFNLCVLFMALFILFWIGLMCRDSVFGVLALLVASQRKLNAHRKYWSNYVVLLIVLAGVLLPIGVEYVGANVNRFPFSVPWFVNGLHPEIALNIANISSMQCTSDSSGYYRTFVAGDRIRCKFNVTYLPRNVSYFNISANASEVPYRVSRIYVYNGPMGRGVLAQYFDTGFDPNILISYEFTFNISHQNYAPYTFTLRFDDFNDSQNIANDKSDVPPDKKNWYYTSISLSDVIESENYQTWLNQQRGIFLAVLAAVFLTLTVGIANLKDIIDK